VTKGTPSATVHGIPKQQAPPDGSTFFAMALGQWQLSHELHSETHAERAGFLGLAFEHGFDKDAKALNPGASPPAEASPLCRFTMKALACAASVLVALSVLLPGQPLALAGGRAELATVQGRGPPGLCGRPLAMCLSRTRPRLVRLRACGSG